MMNDKQIYEKIKTIVLDVLKSQGLLQGQWHLGQVSDVISTKQIKVFVDGSDTSQTVSCNPDITFNVNDEVWVVYINGNPRDKFVISKRAL
jgi:hypothetical protein